MNKRIEQLMNKAYDTHVDMFTQEEYNAFSREKFAILIVEECASLAACNFQVAGFALADLIKEHFGMLDKEDEIKE